MKNKEMTTNDAGDSFAAVPAADVDPERAQIER
jgi:hypothetical protein